MHLDIPNITYPLSPIPHPINRPRLIPRLIQRPLQNQPVRKIRLKLIFLQRCTRGINHTSIKCDVLTAEIVLGAVL